MTLRIVVWNCNLALQSKIKPLLSLRPDIAIIAESANPAVVREKAPDFNFSDVLWIGHNDHKGLGVYSFGELYLAAHHNYNPAYELFLPIKVLGRHKINLLAVWAFNHRSRKSALKNGAPTRAAINYYRHFIQDQPTLIAGDFDNSVVWDKPGKKSNFADIAEDLNKAGFVSAYHEKDNHKYGQEPEPTLLQKKHHTQDCHIDYCFVPGEWMSHVIDVSVGKADEWIRFSDHVPLVADMVQLSTT
jgi:hypothetical protein